MRVLIVLLSVILLSATACMSQTNKSNSSVERHPELFKNAKEITMADSEAKATFGAGCFWCVEAIFQRLDGVKSVVSGFSGGDVENPSYQQVVSGKTGHAEVIHITYDPEVITYGELLEIFWMTHDPTTLNRQGADVGTQYRSGVFYHNEDQKKAAEHYKDKLEKAKIFDDPIVTEISEFKGFYEAEPYHQNYYNNNPDQAYCSMVIRPKLEKFKKVFEDKLNVPG